MLLENIKIIMIEKHIDKKNLVNLYFVCKIFQIYRTILTYRLLENEVSE